MIQVPQPPQKLTFEEYLTFSDGSDKCYELIDGALIPLPPESGLNTDIAGFLYLKLCEWANFKLIKIYCCEIQVKGNPQNRWPDLVVLKEAHLQLTQRRLTMTLQMPAPRLVVEVVSPDWENRQRDYQAKRKQYETRGILEYWIVDPQEERVTVLNLSPAGQYQAAVYQGELAIMSSEFPELQLTAAALLRAGDQQ
ncbi:MAG: Uma2 family endonuclease [Cyanothece sp. SIO1E1]|nr:Uma2 family endonuclease [Cyanothece sp. SIO1E1]